MYHYYSWDVSLEPSESNEHIVKTGRSEMTGIGGKGRISVREGHLSDKYLWAQVAQGIY